MDQDDWEQTYSVFGTEGKAFVHADAMSESIDPGRPELIGLSVEQTGKGIISALGEVAVALILGVLQEVVLVIKQSGPE